MNKDDLEKFKKGHKYVIMNHRYEIDWVCGWIISERVGTLGVSFNILYKKSIERLIYNYILILRNFVYFRIAKHM